MAGVILQRWLWSEEKGDYDEINFRPRWTYSADSLFFNQNLPIWIVFLSNFRNNFQKRLKPPQYDHVLPPLQNGTLNKL